MTIKLVLAEPLYEKTKQSFVVPVSLIASIRDSRSVCVCREGISSVENHRRLPAGDWMTGRWRPTPLQISEALKLIGGLRQEALHTAKNKRRYLEVDKKCCLVVF